MDVNTDVSVPEGVSDTSTSRGQQNNHHPQSSGPADQDLDSFFISQILPDLDPVTFAFPSLASQPIEACFGGSLPHMTDHSRLHVPSFEDFEAFSNIARAPSQFIPHLEKPQSDFNASTQSDLPLLRRNGCRPSSVPVLDDIAYSSICNGLVEHLTIANDSVVVPPHRSCQRFLSSYFASFHSHFPIIHMQSLRPAMAPSPLILAMCSIGALYRLDRRRARQLYDTASAAIETVAPTFEDGDEALVEDYPLWYVQSRLLLTFYAVMSGERDIVLDSMRENGFYTLVYKKAMVTITSHNKDLSLMTRHSWIRRESWKRLLGGIFATSTLTMILFDVNPGFNATQDLDFEALNDEALWNAASPDEWRELWTSLKQQHGLPRRTMKEVLGDIMVQGNYSSNAAPYHVSTFSTLVLMNAVVVQMWQRLQISLAFSASWWSSSLLAPGQDPLGSWLLENTMMSLERCEAFLRRAESEFNRSETEDDKELMLVFNSQAVLRIAYMRLFKPVDPSSRINLTSTDAVEMESSIASFLAARMERGPGLLDVVTKSFEGLRVSVKLGYMLVRKTAAFRWGVENAIAGWESALLVTKWVHSVEIGGLNETLPSPEELEVLALIRDVLEAAECDLSQSVSLAAALAKTWSLLLQDVWVWGITPRMGAALELLAKAYEQAGKANQRDYSTDGMPVGLHGTILV
ncbi:hypothetical protein ACJ41O_001452 [Fusarium nematophilum]